MQKNLLSSLANLASATFKQQKTNRVTLQFPVMPAGYYVFFSHSKYGIVFRLLTCFVETSGVVHNCVRIHRVLSAIFDNFPAVA